MMNNKSKYNNFDSNLLNSTSAMILAGGKGTRLLDLTVKMAKPAVSFGGKFKIIDFTLSNCINSGIRKVGVLTQYMAQDLIRHIHEGWYSSYSFLDEGVHIIPAQQRTGDSWYRGTADAIYQNLDIINKSKKIDRVLILGGDHIYKMDYSKMIKFHVDSGADVTVSCIKRPIEEAKKFGVVQINNRGDIVDFEEKPSSPKAMPFEDNKALVSMGVYIFNIDVLDEELKRAIENPDYKHDFGHNIIPNLIGNKILKCFVFCSTTQSGMSNYWRDVGSVDDYYMASMELLDANPKLDIYDSSWPINTNQVQRPGAKFIYTDGVKHGFTVDSIVSAGCVIYSANIYHSLLSTDVKVGQYSEILNRIILPNVSIGKGCIIKNAIVCEGCVIPNYVIAGTDANRDREFFTITDNDIVIITKEGIDKYIEKFGLLNTTTEISRISDNVIVI